MIITKILYFNTIYTLKLYIFYLKKRALYPNSANTIKNLKITYSKAESSNNGISISISFFLILRITPLDVSIFITFCPTE